MVAGRPPTYGAQYEEAVPEHPNWFKIDNHGLVFYYNRDTYATAWALDSVAVASL